MTKLSRRKVLAALGVGVSTSGCLGIVGESQTTERTTKERTTTTSRQTTTGTPTETTATTRKETATTTEETTVGDWIERASNTPNPSHRVTIENRSDENQTVHLWVVRERTNETVYEETHTVSAEGELYAYNLEQADPDGVEEFRVCAELVDEEPRATTVAAATSSAETAKTTKATQSSTTTAKSQQCETIATNVCYGDVHATVQEDGSLQLIYSIC